MRQEGASAPARLWQLRSVLALDLATQALRTCWERLGTDPADRYLLLTFGGPPRRDNRVRQLSERSYADARLRLREAYGHRVEYDVGRVQTDMRAAGLPDRLAARLSFGL